MKIEEVLAICCKEYKIWLLFIPSSNAMHRKLIHPLQISISPLNHIKPQGCSSQHMCANTAADVVFHLQRPEPVMDVREFYKGKNILITGVTGYVGKAVAEKLLRSCDVGKIFLLIRSRPKTTVSQRLDRIKASVVSIKKSKSFMPAAGECFGSLPSPY